MRPLPALPASIAFTAAQAKARLLELGEEAEAERHERAPLIRKYSALLPIAAAVAGALVAGFGAMRPKQSPGRPEPRRAHAGRGAGFAIPLGLIIKLLRPALPVILRYFAQRRQARQQRAAAVGRRPRAYARR